MKTSNKKLYKQLLFVATLLLATGSFFTSCNSGSTNTAASAGASDTLKTAAKVHPFLTVSASAVVMDEYSGATHTQANDSVQYSSTGSFTGITASNGTCSIKDNNYTAGNLIIIHGYATNIVAGKVFNQALSGTDLAVTAPVFNVVPLQASPYLIPDTVYVTDMSGNPRVGYQVEFKLGRTVIGSPATTNSNGMAVYGTYLQQNQDYTVQASGSGGNSAVIPASTKQLWGTGSKFSSLNVYIRY